MTRDTRPLVLHVIHHLVIGGMENGVVNLINHMPETAYRHAVACIEDFSEFRQRIERPDVEVVALHRSRIGFWRLQHEIYRLCRRLRPAIVHTRNLSGLDALLPARLAGVKHCVHSEHGWDVDNLDGSKRRPALLRRLHSPLISRYVTVSRHLQQYLVDDIRIAPERITQIYNGVNTVSFAPASGKPLHLLPQDFQDERLLLIGTVGRIQAIKDQSTLLNAFARLVGTEPDLRARLRLVVVGDGPLLDQLRRQALDLGIAGQTWFPGALANIADILRAMDVFVLPSLNEGISNTILEAMATGLPVIATAVGGNLELLDDGVCGRLFRPQNVGELRQLLTAYASNPALRRAHGQAARRIAEQRFSLKTMVTQYKTVYADL